MFLCYLIETLFVIILKFISKQNIIMIAKLQSAKKERFPPDYVVCNIKRRSCFYCGNQLSLFCVVLLRTNYLPLLCDISINKYSLKDFETQSTRSCNSRIVVFSILKAFTLLHYQDCIMAKEFHLQKQKLKKG